MSQREISTENKKEEKEIVKKNDVNDREKK